MRRLALLLLSLAAAGCGSNCPQSANGGCNGQTVDTFIHWTLISKVYPWFDETPGGVGATQVKLDLSGPTTMSVTVDASYSQAKLADLPPGMYTVHGMLLDALGNPLTKGMAQTTFMATPGGADVFIDFPFEDFVKSYTGTYFFQVTWGGVASCQTAGVAFQKLTLTRSGVPFSGTTIAGDKLDGTSMRACQDGTSAQAATGLVWGPAHLAVTGLDQQHNVIYMGATDTFIGADLANPTQNLDTASLLPDAGVVDAQGSD